MAPSTRPARVDSLLSVSQWESPKKTTLSDLCDDVLLLICDHLHHLSPNGYHVRKTLSLTNRRLHSLLAPILFKTIRINAPMKVQQPDSLLHHHAQTFKVDMFGSLWWWCSGYYVSGSDAVDLFHFIHKFSNLKTLEVSMMSRSLDIFEAAFADLTHTSIFVLPRVEKLVVTSSAAFLARHCPNLKSLVIRDEGDCMVEAYTDLESRFSPSKLHYEDSGFRRESLTSFDATAIWSASELGYITTVFPELRHLAMRSDTYCYRASIQTIMSNLAKELKYLKMLELSKIEYLDMGFRSVWKRAIQECKTAEKRRQLWKDNERRRVKAENDVARLAFGEIEGLRMLWLGHRRVANRLPSDFDENGKGRVRWMWERKEEETEDCGMNMTWANYRAEREAEVVRSEEGM